MNTSIQFEFITAIKYNSTSKSMKLSFVLSKRGKIGTKNMSVRMVQLPEQTVQYGKEIMQYLLTNTNAQPYVKHFRKQKFWIFNRYITINSDISVAKYFVC